ncbi:MAG: precorrin-6A reductase [Lachnospiraceae bacterium]|nr:precorrin-6A reductase [Lachnospiraceae bacterium]
MTEDRIIIFGGTSEGRELAEYASDHGISVLVSVVSEYGELLLPENACVQVHRGALDRPAMCELLKQYRPNLVLDATHPYAQEATRQIRELCTGLAIPYERVLRDSANQVLRDPADSADLADRAQAAEQCGQVYTVATIPEALALLGTDQRPVFLTTGSKELEQFASVPELRERIYARVLPDSRVLHQCEALGIRGGQLMAVQGPFSVEMNCAMLRQSHAGWLVTKESGSRGGFEEKMQAAMACGVSVIVLARPVQERGISMEEAKLRLRETVPGDEVPGGVVPGGTEPEQEESPRCLTLIGMGMGGGRQLTLEAADALNACDAVLGAPRMLADVRNLTTQAFQNPIYLAPQTADWLEEQTSYRKVSVVYSGDTGFYSGAGSLLAELKQRGLSWQIRICPGISSVSCLCARMQVSWEHLYLASAHGRVCDPAALLREHGRVFLLLGGTEQLGSLCRKLTVAGFGSAHVTAGIRMGYPDEQLLVRRADELLDWADTTLTAVVIEENKA